MTREMRSPTSRKISLVDTAAHDAHSPSAPLLQQIPLAPIPTVLPACILKWTSGWLGASSSLMGPTHSSLCPRAQCSSQHRREQYSSPQPCNPHSARDAFVCRLANGSSQHLRQTGEDQESVTHSPWHTAPEGRRRPQECLSPPRPPRLAPACPSSRQAAVAHNVAMLHFHADLDSRLLIHGLCEGKCLPSDAAVPSPRRRSSWHTRERLAGSPSSEVQP